MSKNKETVKEPVKEELPPIMTSVGMCRVPGADKPTFVSYTITSQGDKVIDVEFGEEGSRWWVYDDVKILVLKKIMTPLAAE